jgi:hypothetical protein
VKVRGSGHRDAGGAQAPRLLLRHHQFPCFPDLRRSTTGRVMGDIVNLKRFKKRAERDRAAKDADARRARFGRTKAERKLDQEQNRKRDTMLDHHHIGEDQT